MMKLIGVARLGADVELRHLSSGKAVANMALAFNYGKKGDDGKRPSQWVEAALFGDRAESLAPYLTKGTALFVDLRDVHVETYQKRDGTTGSKLAGIVDSLDFAGNRPGNEAPTKAAPRQAKQQDEFDDESIPF